MKQRIRYITSRLLNYFLKGLLIVLPFYITVSVIRYIAEKLDQYFDVGVPAVGIFIVIASITVLGWLGSNIILKPMLNLIDDLLTRIPFVKIIYTSVKDFMEAFVGDKRKFNEAVLVELAPGVHKPGFITQKDVSKLGLQGKVGVYFPHSYAFSGNLFFVDTDKVKPFPGNPADIMKFIVSGGVTDIES
jgi:uncharacterized membrane protein